MRPILYAAVITAATAAVAQDRADLPDLIATFVAEEVEGAGPERQAAISACLLGAFDGIRGDELAAILAEDDFEDSLDALVAAYPDREDTIEGCEEL